MRRLSVTIIVIGLLFGITMMAAGKRQRTTRHIRNSQIKSVNQSEVSTRTPDTIRTAANITFSGYDKPLRSTKESMFVSNNTNDTIIALGLQVNYLDQPKRRQLHSRQLTVKCMIPPQQTRQINFQSWDKQQSFYYLRSKRPSKANGTPYDITCQLTFYVK